MYSSAVICRFSKEQDIRRIAGSEMRNTIRTKCSLSTNCVSCVRVTASTAKNSRSSLRTFDRMGAFAVGEFFPFYEVQIRTMRIALYFRLHSFGTSKQRAGRTSLMNVDEKLTHLLRSQLCLRFFGQTSLSIQFLVLARD